MQSRAAAAAGPANEGGRVSMTAPNCGDPQGQTESTLAPMATCQHAPCPHLRCIPAEQCRRIRFVQVKTAAQCCPYCRQRRASTADDKEFATRCYSSSVSRYRCVLPRCFHTFSETDAAPSAGCAAERHLCISGCIHTWTICVASLCNPHAETASMTAATSCAMGVLSGCPSPFQISQVVASPLWVGSSS